MVITMSKKCDKRKQIKMRRRSNTIWRTIKRLLLVFCVLFTLDVFLGHLVMNGKEFVALYSNSVIKIPIPQSIQDNNIGSHIKGLINSNEDFADGMLKGNDVIYRYKNVTTDLGATNVLHKSLLEQIVLGISVRKTVDDRDKSASVKFQCNACFVHNFTYIIENDHICKPLFPGQPIDILFLVFTIHTHEAARNALRITWLSVTKQNTANMRYVFLLGQPVKPEYSERVIEENNKYKDIVKEDFKESYRNLTLKTIMGYKWAATKCQNAKVVIKTDDDMFINVPKMKMVIAEHKKDLSSSVLGNCWYGGRPIRQPNSKWYASVESYPDEMFPGFCSGTCYLTSMSVVQRVYDVSKNIPFFHLEDVYMGLCFRKINVKVKKINGFNNRFPKADPCLYKGNKLVTDHMVSPKMLKNLWAQNCSEPAGQPDIKHIDLQKEADILKHDNSKL